MADSQFVVCAPLCFLVNKFGRLDVKQLKSLLNDFYSLEDIIEAKEQLITDVSSLQLTEKVPRLPTRRDSENRHSHEVNDIITLVTVLDEQKLISCLPKYVVDKPDQMPSARMVEGDLKCFLYMLERLEQRMDLYRDEVNTLGKSVHAVLRLNESKRVVNKPSVNEAIGADRVHRNVNINVNTASESSDIQPITDWADENLMLSSDVEAAAIDDCWNVAMSRKRKRIYSAQLKSAVGLSASGENIATGSQLSGLLSSTPSRSDLVRTVTGVDPSDTNSSSYASAIAKNKLTTSSTGAVQPRTVRRNPMVIGTKPVMGADKVAAAKPYVGKAIYCIDNVSTDVDVVELTSFVIKNGIRVLSCHSVKPRRSRWQRESGITPQGRNTFRLCIPREQSGQLLKPDIWPSHVTISPWIFSKKKQSQPEVLEENEVDRPTGSISSKVSASYPLDGNRSQGSAPVADVNDRARENGGGGDSATNASRDENIGLTSSFNAASSDMETTLIGYYDAGQ